MIEVVVTISVKYCICYVILYLLFFRVLIQQNVHTKQLHMRVDIAVIVTTDKLTKGQEE